MSTIIRFYFCWGSIALANDIGMIMLVMYLCEPTLGSSWWIKKKKSIFTLGFHQFRDQYRYKKKGTKIADDFILG